MKKPQNWGQSCPNPDCSKYNQNSQWSIISVSTYMTQSGKRRIFKCNREHLKSRATI